MVGTAEVGRGEGVLVLAAAVALIAQLAHKRSETLEWRECVRGLQTWRVTTSGSATIDRGIPAL